MRLRRQLDNGMQIDSNGAGSGKSALGRPDGLAGGGSHGLDGTEGFSSLRAVEGAGVAKLQCTSAPRLLSMICKEIVIRGLKEYLCTATHCICHCATFAG